MGNARVGTRALACVVVFMTALAAVVVAEAVPAAAAAPPFLSATIPFPNEQPVGVAVDPTTHRVFVTGFTTNRLFVVDGLTDTVLGSLFLHSPPTDVVVDPGTHKVFVGLTTGDVLVFDGLTNAVITTIDGPAGYIIGMSVDPTTHTLYVTSATGQIGVVVIDGTTNAVQSFVPLTGVFWDVAVNPVSHRAYVTDQLGGVVVIDGPAGAVVDEITGIPPAYGVVVDPTTGKVYVGHNGAVSVIDGATNAVLDTIPVGGGNITAIDMEPGARTVIAAGAGRITSIDTSTDSVNADISVAGRVLETAVDTAAHKAYLPNCDGHEVWVVSIPALEAELTGSRTWARRSAASWRRPAGLAPSPTRRPPAPRPSP